MEHIRFLPRVRWVWFAIAFGGTVLRITTIVHHQSSDFIGTVIDIRPQRLIRNRPTNPFLSGSSVWSLVSSGFPNSPDEVVLERLGAVVA